MLHGDILGERAGLTPDAPAVFDVASGRRLTYRELDDRAVTCARVWQEGLGLRPGDRIGILSENRLEFLDHLFAPGKTGIVLVPLGTRLTPYELAHIVRHSGLRALVYSADFAETVRALRWEAPIEWAISLDGDRRADPGDPWFADLARRRPADPAWRPVRSGPEDVYALLYTSGTTGKPKGVMVPHRMVAWNAYNTAVCWDLRADDVTPVFTPLYHAGGIGAFLMPMVAAGGRLVLHRGFDPAEVWRTIAAEGCTVVLGVPTIYKLLMEAPEFTAVDLSRVRWLISGGAPLPLFIIEAYQRRGVVFKQGYGLTEVGVNCFAMSVEDSRRKKGSIGRPLMFTEGRLADEQGREVAPGEVGELLLRGPHVTRGYWNDPEATAAALDGDGWFHTGDLARRDEEGFFFIAGRKKDMLISGGVNVYPAEIEGELLLHPEVRDAAVVGVPDATWGEVGVAFVVPGGPRAPSPDELTEFLLKRLARYKVPRTFVVVDALPRTAYGKVVKGELARMWREARG